MSEYLSEESYEFEFEDDEESVDEIKDNNDRETLQTQYYTAKAFKDDNSAKAIKQLTEITENDVDNDTALWIFKLMKQIAKIYFQNHEFDKSLQILENLSKFIDHIEDKDYLEESVNKMFNNYSIMKDSKYVLKLTKIVLHMIDLMGKSNNNDRLWIKVTLSRFSVLQSDKRNLEECGHIIRDLRLKLDQVSDIIRDAYLLEIIACEIDLTSLHDDMDVEQLTRLYNQSLTITSPVTHPRIIGVIKQCGGKIEFFNGNYENSRLNFYESFKQYDESGASEKNIIFKYLILLSIITENEFNPFESQETQHYIQEEEFESLVLLINIFNELDLHGLHAFITGLPKYNEFHTNMIFNKSLSLIQDLIIEKILINFFKSYSVVQFEFLEKYLDLPESDLIWKIFKLNNHGKITNIKINFIDKIIECCNSSMTLDNINSKAVLTNMKCLDAINFIDNRCSDVDDMNVDTNFESKKPKRNNLIVSQLIFVNKLMADKTILKCTTVWINSLRNTFPQLQKPELSTKDQIFTEQKAEKKSETSSNFKSSLADLANNDSRKIHLLNIWTTELLNR